MSSSSFPGSLDKLLHKLYLNAGRLQDWNVIRHCSGLLRKIVDSLAPAISTILVHGKVVRIHLELLVLDHVISRTQYDTCGRWPHFERLRSFIY